MADVFSCRALCVAKTGVDCGGSILEIRNWVTARGGPGYTDLISLQGWIEAYNPGGGDNPGGDGGTGSGGDSGGGGDAGDGGGE